MGGPVPLGFQTNGRTLAVVEAEAESTRGYAAQHSPCPILDWSLRQPNRQVPRSREVGCLYVVG
jgi:hypothetical protein